MQTSPGKPQLYAGLVITLNLTPHEARIVHGALDEFLKTLRLRPWQRSEFAAVANIERTLSDQLSAIDMQLSLLAKPPAKADRPS